ncbi:hypothetical protein Btru_036397 [Bulinus truncatus]|nr:hypothetical protein Btru_036397 [Bulinus truncatus]
MLFKALALWAVLVLTHADPNSSFSCKLPSPVSTAPQMPTVFQSDSYQSTVEINILDKNYSIVTQEYLDYQNNVGAIIAYKNGAKTQVIYSYSTGEIFQINVDGKVRGLPVNIWATCLTYSNTVGPIKASYYFLVVKPGWNTSWSQQQMPLRVEIEGLTQSSTFGSATTVTPARYFHHMYDFINYVPTVDSTSSVFEVWYNEQAKLVREDTRSLHPDPKVGVTTTVSEIHDFSTGVRYIIDPKGGCSAFPIDSKQADAKEDMARFQYNQSIIIDIRDPNSFFQFNDNYIYVGQRLVRGITCDVFSALIPNFNAGGNNVDATFEFYFLPVDFVRIYNFFDFAEFFVQADAFDATQCTQPDEKIKLRITFSGDYNPATLEKWKQQTYFKLAEFMQINPIRIGSLTVEADSYNIYVSAWILGTANYAQFQQIDKPSKEHVDDKVIYGVNSPLDCADLCINNQEFQCNAYEYCLYNRYACRLLKDHMPAANNTEIVNATECVLNTRPIAGPAVKETPVATAYSNLVQAVQNKQVFLSMQDSSGVSYYVYRMGKGLNESPGYYRMGKGLNESPGYSYYGMGKGLNESPGYSNYRMGKGLNESPGYSNYGMGKGLNESPGYYRMGKGLNESPGYYRMGKGLNESPGYYRMGKGLNESPGYYRMGKGLNESPGYYRMGKGLNESPGYYRMGKGLNESPGYYRMGKGLNESPGYYTN